eukprot:10048485-Karenia_brevis.AAC.1
MAVLKLINLGSTRWLRISFSKGVICWHCQPCSQSEMAALKLIILGSTPSLRISSNSGATRCHCPPCSQAE